MIFFSLLFAFFLYFAMLLVVVFALLWMCSVSRINANYKSILGSQHTIFMCILCYQPQMVFFRRADWVSTYKHFGRAKIKKKSIIHSIFQYIRRQFYSVSRRTYIFSLFASLPFFIFRKLIYTIHNINTYVEHSQSKSLENPGKYKKQRMKA